MKLPNKIQRRIDRWRGLRYAEHGGTVTVDRSGWYQVTSTILLYRNDVPESASHTMNSIVYCNAGDVLRPGSFGDVIAHRMRAIGHTARGGDDDNE